MIAYRTARILGFAVVTMRLFYAIAIDAPRLENAGWLAALMACLAAAPAALLLAGLDKLRRENELPRDFLIRAAGAPTGKVYMAILAVLSVYEGAVVARMLTHSAEFIALATLPFLWILLYAVAGMGLAAAMGARAVGGTAKFWLYAFAPLMLIVIVVQLPHYNPRWLTPILGPGLPAILAKLNSFAGIYMALVPLWLLRGAEKKPWATISILACAATAAAALLALAAMMAPAMPGAPETFAMQMRRLLSNGRADLSLQFPLVIIWYMSLALTLSYDLLVGTEMLKLLIPRLDRRLCALAAAAGVFVAAYLGWAERPAADLTDNLRYPLAAAPLLLFYGMALWKERRKRRA